MIAEQLTPAAEYMTYPRIYFTANDADFSSSKGIPPGALLRGEEVAMNDLFGIAKASVKWEDIIATDSGSDLT
jgi:hypothetical protein